jgi:hypothetical protein
MRRFLTRTCRFLALAAAFTVLVAQVGALAHGWSHAAHIGSAHVAAATGHDHHHGHHHHDEHGDGKQAALCDLCAHFAAVLHWSADSADATFAAVEGRFATPRHADSNHIERAAFHYPARAPPIFLI